METLFKEICRNIALGIEAAAVLIVLGGALRAFWSIITLSLTRSAGAFPRRRIWLGFGVWLVLGLEFQLAADIIRTAIAPSWAEIGQLAAIAVIRTGLDHFLQEDMRRAEANPS